MFRLGAFGICFIAACASGGTKRPLVTPGQPTIDVFTEGGEPEESDGAVPVVATWMLDNSRPGDSALWGTYARALHAAVAKNPDGFALADETARSAMAKAAADVGKVQSKYLREDLPKIDAAGFMQEHTRLELEGGGDAPAVRPDRVLAYIRWRVQTVPDMVPETAVGVKLGRRKLIRRTVPWPSVAAGMGTFLKFAIERKDCQAIEGVAEILIPAWAMAKKAGGAYSMDADQRHLDFLKKNVKESDNVVMYPTAYRDAAMASAGCARRSARNDVALARAVLALEMDPLCSACWSERAAAHVALGDTKAAKEEALKAQQNASTPAEQKMANEILDILK